MNDWARRVSEDGQRAGITETYFMIRPPLFPFDATVLRGTDYVSWLSTLNLDGWHVLGCGVGRVGGILLQGRGKK